MKDLQLDNDPAAKQASLEARRAHILESATGKHVVKRAVHAVTGHPRSDVYWGDAIEGATCACGAHWTNADMRV